MKRIILISLCLFVLTSCTNFINETIYDKVSTEESPTETINFIGNIQANGALPSTIFELAKNDQTRSALPTISNLSLFATATTSDGSLNRTGNFLESSHNIRFSISLSTGHTWTITCGLKTSNGAIVFSDSCQVTITNDNPVFSYNFQPQITEGSGSVNLPITLENGTNIDHITATCPSSSWNASVDDISSPSLVASDIPCGSYEVTINFYEASNILKYSTTQYITVLNSLTTDTWISDESGLINDDGVFNLTKSLIDQYIRTIFYIGNTGLGSEGLGSEPSDTNGSGSPYEPFESLSKAIDLIASTGDSTKNYQIFISGPLKGKQTLTSSLDNKAASITIQGLNGLDENKIPKDSLNGNQEDTTLTVETSVPISIKNLKITGGKGVNGGGLYLENQSVVKLLDGTLITENEATSGGGVYNEGTLFMSGSAMIGKSTSTIATSSSYGNKATSSGAGIYSISGAKIYLGYTSWTSTSVNSPSELTGGVCGNYLSNSVSATANGGGIYTQGQLYINSGNISYNYAINGAGIYTKSNITMTGGTISGNIAKTHGGAVYMHDYNDTKHIDLQISGSSYIPYGGAVNKNDIYMLDFHAKITITGSLSNREADKLISITPKTYTDGTTLLKADSGVSLVNELSKFRVTPDSNGKEWSIDTNGNLSSHTYITKETLANFSPNNKTSYNITVDSSFGNTEVNSLLSTIKNNVGEGTILDLSNSTATSISEWLYSGVSSITLPATLSSIYSLPSQFFQGADTLTEIIVPESNTVYCSQNGVLYTKDMTGLIKYPAAKKGDSFTLPAKVRQLYYQAFYGNKNLTTINGLTQITSFINNDSDGVFSKCEKLVEIDLSGLSSTCSTLSAYTIRNSKALKKVTLSSNITTIEFACFQSLSNLEEVHFKTNTPPSIKFEASSVPTAPDHYKNFKDCQNVKFYVPSDAVAAYQKATGENGICNPDYNGAATTKEGLQALIIGE
ncbi:MAG: leucine-rich repeat protein [Treponema sp.]|nr:leucine-rich repeat protein [Treponema sp.]